MSDKRHGDDPDFGSDLDGVDEALSEDASTDAAAPQDPEVEQELARLQEALLRTRAEMDNVQKRSQRELERSRRYQLEAILRDLIPVIDSLEQGLANLGDDADEVAEGMRLTHRQLLTALTNHGCETIDPAGERFDPSWHEAMSIQPSESAPPDTVLQVLQKGYRLNDRLLRPARVIVASGD